MPPTTEVAVEPEVEVSSQGGVGGTTAHPTDPCMVPVIVIK
jgi:hypothetical protein